ncbi:endonuclease/exonuclease/phosphatase family protein [Anaerolineales bacterium HSG24]|nr:endonuclease/exonuclease/phosphatase family protein [Anaerolineales bacterium HSG24]
MKKQLHAILKQFGLMCIAASQLLTGAVLIWFVLRVTVGDQLLFVRVMSYLLPWLFLGLGVSFLIALLARRRGLAGLTGLLLLPFLYQFGPIFLPKQSVAQVDDAACQFRVMSYNVNMNNENNIKPIAELIRAQSPDILTLQEMVPRVGNPLQAELQADYPYQLLDDTPGLGRVVMSRYPLQPYSSQLDDERIQQVLVETPAGLVMVFNMHPAPAMASGWVEQHRVFQEVAQVISETDKPILLLGDFNSTPFSQNYYLIDNLLTDVHAEVGQGFAMTFPNFKRAITQNRSWITRLVLSMPPLAHIDHIFVSEQFHPLNIKLLPETAGSDHYPLVAEVALDGCENHRMEDGAIRYCHPSLPANLRQGCLRSQPGSGADVVFRSAKLALHARQEHSLSYE